MRLSFHGLANTMCYSSWLANWKMWFSEEFIEKTRMTQIQEMQSYNSTSMKQHPMTQSRKCNRIITHPWNNTKWLNPGMLQPWNKTTMTPLRNKMNSLFQLIVACPLLRYVFGPFGITTFNRKSVFKLLTSCYELLTDSFWVFEWWYSVGHTKSQVVGTPSNTNVEYCMLDSSRRILV